jgi:hypothetical protein
MAKIHKAITAVMAAIATTGIAKSQRNAQQGFSYRGIEAAMNELNPLLVANGITVAARYSDLDVSDRVNSKGTSLRFAILKGCFTFSVDEDSHVVFECYGEAMDSGDKAVTKAQSVAFRTALFQIFVVPTVAIDPEEHDEDPFSADVFEISQAATLAELQTVWGKKRAGYLRRKDRAGVNAIDAAKDARKIALTEGGA